MAHCSVVTTVGVFREMEHEGGQDGDDVIATVLQSYGGPGDDDAKSGYMYIMFHGESGDN